MRTLFLTVAILAAGFAYGQNSPQISVSTEKVNVNGEIMYVHNVKGKETLYSIAKAYNVSIEDIVRTNEQLKGGLKEGSKIYIPSGGAAPEAVPESAITAEKVETVVAKESPASEKKNKLSGSEIKKYSKKKHTVKWYETIEDIAAKYKVTVDDIVGFNNLESTVLNKKQVLYIPNDGYIAYIAQQKKLEQEKTVAEIETQKEVQEQVEEEMVHTPLYNTNEVTYILPLALKDTLGPANNFMDFYAGALLAANHLKEKGMDLKVNLVDQLQYNSINELYASADLSESGKIIGPVKSSDISKLLELSSGRFHTIISPMDQLAENLVEGNPALFQVPPTTSAQQENIVALFARKCTEGSNPIIIYEKGTKDTTLINMAQDALESKGIAYTTFSYALLEGREILEKILPLMKPECNNLVFIPSNSEAFVSDVVRNMNLVYTNPLEENRRNITLFGLPKWRNFEGIEVDYFHRMNLHLSLPYFVDYGRVEVKDFLMKYRALFNNEPTPFAFQGYDVTLSAFSLGTGNNVDGTLQINFKIGAATDGNGLSNTGTTDIAYNPDYTITVIK